MERRPISAFRLEFAWRTDKGRVRQRNEDAVAVHPDLGLVIVADGVGGASAGDVASHLATETISERFGRLATPRSDPEKARLYVEAAVEEANISIWRHSKQSMDCTGMGTTVVVGSFGWDWMAYAHVGDSRIYRLSDSELVQLSRDHSFIQEVVDQGFFTSREDARRYGIGENILTRALGSAPGVGVSSDLVEIREGDLFVFCTDGLTGMVPEEWMRQILLAVGENSLESAADALVRLANERGGTDNITLALVKVGERVD
ncbi:PP2C family protein-serine/threonine phosphatase [Imhoffiella purpurea]|uniref:Protein serine/threonine phosphatase PrpC, regulation of stationary phase n=1 Tax=Imhoffiella purpurea TaxID=1249627 RepID=W9V6C4_9GAMM|nr:protein phosphatase 2C domain-containing protein [Imhoffiella purpurea]EXJ15118.1 Protein serine/threonine phosphatase PrpC, regulation of stationary phase [Imhoffiella purpurea]